MHVRKLLVVDDERDICEFVKNFLQERGYEVMAVSNGDDALASVKDGKPDLVLLDIKMQGMDGIAVLKHLKDIDRRLKVVMVTALEDQDKMDEAKKLGAWSNIWRNWSRARSNTTRPIATGAWKKCAAPIWWRCCAAAFLPHAAWASLWLTIGPLTMVTMATPESTTTPNSMPASGSASTAMH